MRIMTNGMGRPATSSKPSSAWCFALTADARQRRRSCPPIMGIGTTVILILWTRTYARQVQERAARETALATAKPAA